MSRRSFSQAFLLLALCLSSSIAFSQTIVGRITGTVTDSTGAAVPGVSVKVTNEATGQSRVVTADPNGFYVATNLPVGNYNVSVEHQGFKRSSKTGVMCSSLPTPRYCRWNDAGCPAAVRLAPQTEFVGPFAQSTKSSTS